MIRTLATLLLFGFAVAAETQTPTTFAPRLEQIFPDKPSLMHGIELNEAALQRAQSTKAPGSTLVIIYSNLGSLYEEAALYLKAEDAMRHAIALLRTGPQDHLAAELGHLGMLHSAMDQTGEAEKETLEALRIRESIGDPVGIALASSDLAAVYIKQHHYKKALDPAQKANDILAQEKGTSQVANANLAGNLQADPADRIAVRQTLAYALCGIHQCDRAIPLLQDAAKLASDSFGPDSLSVGCANFLLGSTYWHAGDMDNAAIWMQRGIQRMKVDMSWGHFVYLSAVAQYAAFLRKRGQTEAASAAELELRQARSVVDARSFTAHP
jgi:tetratricopeptide (TPR) repeat protein